MNFSQRFGLFILIIISITYVYFSFFADKKFEIPEMNTRQEEARSYNPFEKPVDVEKKIENKQEKNPTKWEIRHLK